MKEKMKLQGILWPNMNIWQSEIGSMPKNKAFMTAKKDVLCSTYGMCLLNTFSVFPDPNFSIIS